jgi:lipopolysaccharide export system permease protein
LKLIRRSHAAHPMMRTLDRYIVSHFSRPFLVGVAAFTAVILGVGQLYEVVQLIVESGVPVMTGVEVFLLRMPMMIALTMPMATLFAALMSAGELSSHGEVVAMRAGGIAVGRMMRSVVLASVLVALFGFGFNELVGPACNQRATRLITSFLVTTGKFDRPLHLRMPDSGPTERIVIADKFSPSQKSMSNVIVIEYRGGKPRDVYTADRAEWRGADWVLVQVVHKEDTGRGYREEVAGELEGHIGKTLEEIQSKAKQRPEDLSLNELLARVRNTPAERLRHAAGNDSNALWFLQHFHIRIATPWASLCFAVLGFPLGLRPQRTSTGIGFGLSLAVVFVYYIVLNVLRAFGEQGALSPLVAAWVPNLMVLGVGIGLLFDADR